MAQIIPLRGECALDGNTHWELNNHSEPELVIRNIELQQTALAKDITAGNSWSEAKLVVYYYI